MLTGQCVAGFSGGTMIQRAFQHRSGRAGADLVIYLANGHVPVAGDFMF